MTEAETTAPPVSETGATDNDRARSILRQFPAPDEASFQDTPAGRRDKQIWSFWPTCVAEMARYPWLDNEVAEAALVVLSGGATESGWNVYAVGDGGESIGVFQLHSRGKGAGLTVEERQSVRVQFDRIVHETDRADNRKDGYAYHFAEAWAAGLKGADLAAFVCGRSEKPYDDPANQYDGPYQYGKTWTHLRNQVTW